jgi:acyl-homoserine lactone acylase PvdQ
MQTGSNGFALAPQTASGNAILYINPHTFYFRPEIQMSSEEGLNAYGANLGNFFHIKDLMKIVDGCTL